ncbi:MAG: apolipoprotein N-acyltransferase, partial [Pseudomonadota bacterium]
MKILPTPAAVLAFMFGMLGGLGFAPWNLAPLMIGSLAVLLYLFERLTAAGGGRARAFRLAWSWGFGNFLVGQFWIAKAFEFQANMPPVLGWVAVVALSAIMALYPGVSAAVAVRFRRDPLARTLAFAGVWMLSEWLRGYLFSGFGWNPLGVVALPLGDLAQVAALIGTLGVSGLLVLTACGAANIARGRWRLGGLLSAPAILGMVLGGLSLQPMVETTTRIDIIQANIGQDEKYGPDALQRAIRRYALLTPPPGNGPRLLIWPEAAIPDLLDERALLRQDLGRALLGPNDLLIVGALKGIRGSRGTIEAAYNSLYILAPD